MLQSNTKRILAVFIFFSIGYSLISLVNNYLFRTSALDLGLFNHALYNYSHFQLSYFTLGLSEQETGIIECFGNHFSPFIFLLIPFYYLFGTYTLLLVQIGFVLLGGLGIYKYSCSVISDSKSIFFFVIQFFSIWGIYSALSFDFHMNVIAAMLVPWLIYFYKTQKTKYFISVFILMLLTRENTSLWLVFILAGMLLDKSFRSTAKFKYLLFVLMPISVIYFIIVIQFIMPKFVPYESAGQLSYYQHLGSSFSDIIHTLITQPKKIISLLFFSPFEGDVYRHIKTELYIMAALSGGILFLFRPSFFIMLIPIFLQKLLSSNTGMWGINYHYSIEFVPVLSLLLIETTAKMKRGKIRYVIIYLITFTTIFSTLYTFFHRKSVWYDKARTCFICKEHYQTSLNVPSIYDTFTEIPPEAKVSTNFNLAPHLAFRKKIYQYPVVKDADFIILLKETSEYYPLSKEDYFNKIDDLRKNNEFSIWLENESVIIFKLDTE